MSERLADLVGAALGVAPARARVVAGGDVNRALRVDLVDGRSVFVKHGGGDASMYGAEAGGLAWLAEPGSLRVPRVLAVGDDDVAVPGDRVAGARAARATPRRGARAGARGAPRAGAERFGLDGPGYVGPLHVPNAPAPDWAAFYGDRRLRPLAAMAERRGSLPDGWRARIEALADRLPDLVGPPEPPARLHGDLWSGNVMALADGSPALVDPAAYGGHREIDLAMLRLFGGASARFEAAYDEAHPLAPGWRERVPLMQALPLLVHVILFGGGYVGALGDVLDRHVSRRAGALSPSTGATDRFAP